MDERLRSPLLWDQRDSSEGSGEEKKGREEGEKIRISTRKLRIYARDIAINCSPLIAQNRSGSASDIDCKIFLAQAVTMDKLADQAVVAAKLATNAVISSKIGPAAVTEDKIADGAVGANKLQPGIPINMQDAVLRAPELRDYAETSPAPAILAGTS